MKRNFTMVKKIWTVYWVRSDGTNIVGTHIKVLGTTKLGRPNTKIGGTSTN
jgi:hypothetical protein